MKVGQEGSILLVTLHLSEINRVRVNIFQCEFNREPMQLPEPVGDVVILQEKVFVPVQQYPDVSIPIFPLQ